MKLFMVKYMDDCDEDVYLTLGEDNDTNETISKREQSKVEDKCSCYMGHWVFEINNIDGYDIKIETKKVVSSITSHN